jgi:hypothetical protein
MEKLFPTDEAESIVLEATKNTPDQDVWVKVTLNPDLSWISRLSQSDYWDGGATGCDGHSYEGDGTFTIESDTQVHFTVVKLRKHSSAFGGYDFIENCEPFTLPLTTPFIFQHRVLTANLVAKEKVEQVNPVPPPQPTTVPIHTPTVLETIPRPPIQDTNSPTPPTVETKSQPPSVIQSKDSQTSHTSPEEISTTSTQIKPSGQSKQKKCILS